jgi:hypothetical protein
VDNVQKVCHSSSESVKVDLGEIGCELVISAEQQRLSWDFVVLWTFEF